VRPARFTGAFFADVFGEAGPLADFFVAHLALWAATIRARPSGLNFHFFVTRAAGAVEEAVGATWSLWRRSAIRDSICFSFS
jgi:hypothetical protein